MSMTKLYDATNWPKLGIEATDYPFIGTVDSTPKIGRVLDVSGQKFAVHKDLAALSPPSGGFRP